MSERTSSVVPWWLALLLASFGIGMPAAMQSNKEARRLPPAPLIATTPDVPPLDGEANDVLTLIEEASGSSVHENASQLQATNAPIPTHRQSADKSSARNAPAAILAPLTVTKCHRQLARLWSALKEFPAQLNDRVYGPWAPLTDSLRRLKGSANQLDIHFLIATVPDPIDSHLQLVFDNQIAAMQWALVDHGYLLDRYTLPWKVLDRKKAASGVSPLTYRKHPGLVLFRWPDSNNPSRLNYLALLLVGETPTSGIHKPAMTECLDLVAVWQTVFRPTELQLDISILGPTFSGTSASLRQCLDQWRRRHDVPHRLARFQSLNVSICSGSATSFSNQATLSRADPRMRIRFEATVVPDVIALSGIIGYLTNDRCIQPEKIALLTESGTEYGISGAQYIERDQRNNNGDYLKHKSTITTSGDQEQHQAASAEPCVAETSDQEGSQSRSLKSIVILHFPMQIGRLRSEYDKVPELKFGPAVAASPAPRRNLELTFDQSPFAVDAVPVYSGETPEVVERQLAAALSTISRRDIRAVGIMATDVNDILFLAKEVRNYSPDVQLFAVDNDLLYANEDYSRYTEGMLVASPYPLCPNNQAWTGSQAILPFPNSAAEGTYNATLVLLSGSPNTDCDDRALSHLRPQLSEYHVPFSAKHDQSQNKCSARFPAAAKPPLWLAVVGRDGLWPVQAWEYKDPTCYVHAEKNPTTSSDKILSFPSGVNTFIAESLSLLCVFLLFIRNPALKALPLQALRKVPDDDSQRWYSGVWAPFAPLPRTIRDRAVIKYAGRDMPPDHHLRAHACVPALAFFAVLLLANLCFSAPLWRIVLAGLDVWGRHRTYWFVLPGNVVAVALLAYSVFRLAWEAVLRVRPGKSYSPGSVMICALVVLASLALPIGLWCIPWDAWIAGNQLPDAVFAERLGTYSSGVSPLVATSLLIAIIGLWGICDLRRLYFLSYYHIASPLGNSAPPSAAHVQHNAGIKARLDELSVPLSQACFRPQRLTDYVFLAATAISFIYIFIVRWNGTVEDWRFDIFLLAVTLIAVVLLAFLHVRLMAVSGLFERLLRRLGQHALTRTLQYVPERLARKAAGSIFSPAPHPGDHEQSVRLLNQICDRWPAGNQGQIDPIVNELSKNARDASLLLNRLMAIDRSRRLQSFEFAAALNDVLAQAGNSLADRLEQFWSCRDVAREQDGEKPVVRDKSLESDAELFIVMQLTHLIRQVFAHIQNLLTFVVLMALLLLWALNSYPFQPHRLIVVFSYAMVLWIVVSFVIMFVKFNRDEVLSRLAGTTPNRFTWDRSFVMPLITYAVIPLMSLAAVQFPYVSQSLFSWIGLLQRALHG
jgi:hypothetical protein